MRIMTLAAGGRLENDLQENDLHLRLLRPNPPVSF